MKRIALILCLCLSVFSCRTISFDQTGSASEKTRFGQSKNKKEEQKSNETEVNELVTQELLKEVDIEKTVVYVERPVYYPAVAESDRPDSTGKDAVKESTSSSLQSPSQFNYGTMYYDFGDDFTFEIYCQPYRVTDIILEPGEQVIEMPFLSEEKVWEIGAGVSRTGGVDTQHFFLKPAYSGLVTAFIIITDRRVYHLLLKSYKDAYMTQVKWKYPNTMPFKLSSDKLNGGSSSLEDALRVDPRYLSFDYKMSYSLFKRPYWLPQRVYDDGRKTYIVMDETVLHMATPVIFNKRNQRVNYFVEKNLIVINELIERVTIRIGWDKVVIRKKRFAGDISPDDIPKEEEGINALLRDDGKGNEEQNRVMMLHSNQLLYSIPEKEEETDKKE